MRVRSVALGVSYLQALEHPATRRPPRSGRGRAPVVRPDRDRAAAVSELKFARAAPFLRHIIEHAQTASLKAVGYSSEDRFRSAFKKAPDLSPKMWRETMQPQPLARVD